MKHVNFVPKDVQRILSSHKSIMNRKCSTRKLFLKISEYSQENTCVGISFLIKMQAFRDPALLKETRTQVFFANIEKFLRAPILKNICERLLLRVSLELFRIWTNNTGSEETFSPKNRLKTQLYEKKQLKQWAINPGPMEKLNYLFTYTVHFVLIIWTSELGSALLSSSL